MSKFDAFTESARRVVTLAQEEARRFHHHDLGIEHLLLTLLLERNGMAARVLSNMGLRLSKVRAAVEYIIGLGEGAASRTIGMTPRA